jgi:nucleotide-binding universal stress UspA family protein
MFEKVMWATDGSEAADQALPAVKDLARVGSGEVVVVHIVERTLPSSETPRSGSCTWRTVP